MDPLDWNREGLASDDMIWRSTQGVPPFRLKVPKRLLVSPIPSLATHVESDHLAPGREWGAVANEVLEWAAARHLIESTTRGNS